MNPSGLRTGARGEFEFIVVLCAVALGALVTVFPLISAVITATISVVVVAIFAYWVGGRQTNPAASFELDRVDNDFPAGRAAYKFALLFVTMPAIAVHKSTSLADLLVWIALTVVVATAAVKGSAIDLPMSARIWGTGLILVGIGGAVSSVASENSLESMKLAFRMIALVGGFVLAAPIVLRTEQHVRSAAKWWIAGVFVSSTIAISQAVKGESLGVGIFAQDRASGLTNHYNDLGSVAGIAAFAGLFLFAAGGATSKSLGLVVGLVCLGGIVAAGSIGGLIVLLVVAGAFAAISRRGARIAQVVGAATLALALLAVAGPAFNSSPVERLSGYITGTSAPDQNTALIRWNDWQYGARYSLENPVIGVGFDSEGSTTPSGAKVQNAVLQSWFEAGLLGLVGAGFIVLAPLIALRRTVRLPLSHGGILASLLGAMYFGQIFLMSEQIVFQKALWWVPCALLLALDATLRSDGSMLNTSDLCD